MKLKGIKVSNGIDVAKALIHESYECITEKEFLSKDEVPANISMFRSAKKSAISEIDSIIQKSNDDAKTMIMQAHREILDDEAMIEDIIFEIVEDLKNVFWAVDDIFSKYENMLKEVDDELIKERALDVKDVKIRLLRCLEGKKVNDLSELDEPCIIIANDLLTSEMATIDRKNVKGIVLETGGVTSHTAIMSKLYEIPAILSVKDATIIIKNDDVLAIDAINGEIIVNPTEEEENIYKKMSEDFKQEKFETAQYLHIEPKSLDGVQAEIFLNISFGNENELELSEAVGGVGLFRTEFLYMNDSKLPNEEKQFQVYKKVLEHFKEKPVTIRTLDIGGDKQLEALQLDEEDNPFLGNRALRLCFTKMDIFETQLRALLRASKYGNLWLMLPMVTNIEDVRKAKSIINDVRLKLESEGYEIGKYKLGIMIEVPSIALIADLVAEETDFASIGTNDLTQYTTATDRLNNEVARYYNNFNIGLLRLLKISIDAYNKVGKPISVCGEMGGSVETVAFLLGAGLKKISMSSSSVAKIKKFIANSDVSKLKQIADKVLNMHDEGEAEEYIKNNI